jgi:adenylate kinase
MLNLVLLGPPGAGKGTQSKKIIDKYHLSHLSTGDLLRAEVMAQTELGLKAKELIFSGKLVPDEIVIGMIDQKLKANQETVGFVFDGYPRNIKQAQTLDDILVANHVAITHTIAMEVPEKILIQRILQRGKENGRFDDQNEMIVKNRVITYLKEAKTISEFYQKQNKFTSIDGIGSMEEVFDAICMVIDQVK